MITREDFEALVAVETRARDHYEEILARVRDERIRRNIEIIRNDENKHIEIAKRLLKIVSR